ncbi:MAG: flavin reductase family protein [Candidatus Aminicenantes bacterium]|nr:flavin reductase family protein [Candidatus Aminicenantes bacterium]
MAKKIITNLKHFQYFYPYTVALVGAKSGHKINFMSCAWHSALSFNPPLFGVLLSKKRLTHSIISEAREFSVNFLSYDQAKISAIMGRKSGREVDKIKLSGLHLLEPKNIQSPLIAEAYVAFECRLEEIHPFGDHDLFVGQILAVHVDSEGFNQEGVLEVQRIRPLCYLGSDCYVTIDPESFKRVLPD